METFRPKYPKIKGFGLKAEALCCANMAEGWSKCPILSGYSKKCSPRDPLFPPGSNCRFQKPWKKLIGIPYRNKIDTKESRAFVCISTSEDYWGWEGAHIIHGFWTHEIFFFWQILGVSIFCSSRKINYTFNLYRQACPGIYRHHYLLFPIEIWVKKRTDRSLNYSMFPQYPRNRLTTKKKQKCGRMKIKGNS